MKKLLLGMMVLLGVLPSVDAKSFVWKIEKDGKEAYVGGTIHILREKDLPLPKVYQEVYQLTDNLVLEVDGNEMLSPKAQKQVFEYGQYHDGRTLEKVLSPKIFAKLKQSLKHYNIPLSMVSSMKPSLVSVSLIMTAAAKLGAKPEGIDMIYFKKASNDKRDVLSLETVEQQLKMLLGNDDGHENEIIEYTLDEIDKLESFLDKTITSLKSGDVDSMVNELVLPMKKQMPDMYQQLLVQRNLNWIPQIEAMLKTPEKEFILVGAAHLIGTDGILTLLEKKGYTIQQLD